jgi:hypothetical protein
MKLEAKARLKAVLMDSKEGIGAVPYNQDVEYFGLKVMMRPKTFLALATHYVPKQRDIDSMIEYIKEGKPVGPPFLQLEIPERWQEGDFSQPAKVDGHEGRHRMTAILQAEGNDPVETHLFPRYYRARDIDRYWVAAFGRGLLAEGTERLVKDVLK